jgi:hypothetical protein
MLEPVPQSHLLGRRQAAKLWIAFKSAALLGGRNIFVTPKPRTGVARLIAWVRRRHAALTGLRVSGLRVSDLPISEL